MKNINNSICFPDIPEKNRNYSVYLDSLEITSSDAQQCGQTAKVKIVQRKAFFYNGKLSDYIISLSYKFNDHHITDVFPPYHTVYEYDIETQSDTEVKISLRNGYNSKVLIRVTNGEVISEIRSEEMSDKAYELFKRILPPAFLAYNLPIIIFALIALNYWWLPILLFSGVYVPLNVSLIRYAVKANSLKRKLDSEIHNIKG